MLRHALVVLGASVLTLGLAMGLAAAQAPVEKPPPLLKKKAPALDPVWAKQLATKLSEKVTAPDVSKVEPPTPNFAVIRRMTLGQKAIALQATEERVTGPIRVSVRTPSPSPYIQLQLESNNGKLTVFGGRDYAYFSGPEAAFNSGYYFRPRVWLVFRAEPGRRYLIECAVRIDGDQPGTISARLASGTYSVSSADRATLLARYDGGFTPADVMVEIFADRPWFFEGCELSWTSP